MTEINAHAYNIIIRHAQFGGEPLFEARARELPDLVEYADTANEAYELVVDAIQAIANAFAEKGRSMPIPIAMPEDYSGRVTLRLPKSLHRALAGAATDENVSLNQHIVNILSYYSGFAAARTKKRSEAASAEEENASRQDLFRALVENLETGGGRATSLATFFKDVEYSHADWTSIRRTSLIEKKSPSVEPKVKIWFSQPWPPLPRKTRDRK
jgi:predicted HicB family RNase H-like nuclease